jgi:hypothetical protein
LDVDFGCSAAGENWSDMKAIRRCVWLFISGFVFLSMASASLGE